MVEKVISGGQTGVDRAALDVARDLGLPCGGWCPKGRRAEDGPLADSYPLRETPSADYRQRTEWNVRDSDGTLVLTWGSPQGGTALTIEAASRRGKPCLAVDLKARASGEPDAQAVRVRAWMRAQGIRVLNVAGPRESEAPGIYAKAGAFLRKVLGPG